jgi:SEC-C motif-containing protein
MAKSKQNLHCPCGSGSSYQQCCERYISGKESAPDAAALMRSRYTAYTLEDQKYLQQTWHPRSRPELHLDQQDRCKWLGLKVIAYQPAELKATVEFIARYKVNGRAYQLHEISKFEFEDGHWLYVDGAFPNQS